MREDDGSRCRRKAEKHHWPYTKAQGGRATVPICHIHHMAAHTLDARGVQVINDLITRAPSYWAEIGEWHLHRESFFSWIEKQRYKQAIGAAVVEYDLPAPL